MSTNDEKLISARDLLRELLELRRLAPDLAEWDEEHFGNSPPKLFGLKRLIALFAAFEIEWNVAKFVRGAFIKPKSARYRDILDKAAVEMSLAIDDPLGPHSHQLPRCFQILLGYRQNVEATVSCFAGTLMASGMNYYALQKTGTINRIIRDNLGIVDDLLVSLISPEAKSFPVGQLERFHFRCVGSRSVENNFGTRVR